ncbi:hypothetical protein [Paenibacillus sp. B-A-8]|uniref:phosphorylase family protein n=1 Tax=Paenibacillus sp. B-A-8 TaxID=3400419 RepID=UPI003B0159B2
MKILIVDDENVKASNVKDALLNNNEIVETDIIIVPSINDAIGKMLNERYALMVVDMCIPENYGNKLHDDGGLKLIKILSDDKRVFAPTEIIVLTSHGDLMEKYKDEVLKKSFEIIVYNDTSEEWKEKINDKVLYLKRYLESPQEKREHYYDIAILTAVECEKEAVRKLSEDWEKVTFEDDSTVYYSTMWKNNSKGIKVITTSLTQMGMVPAATISMKMILKFAPRYIIMPGIAGGVKNEYEFGDIIIPREVKDYCSGKYTTPKNLEEAEEAIRNPLKFFIPTASSISTDPDIINIVSNSFKEELRKIYDNWPNNNEYKVPSIRTGYMASGDSVVQNSSVIEMMIKNHLRSADGLDMEAYGVYYAAQQSLKPKPIPICMKSISDFADKEKGDDHQAYAAYVSANFLKFFVTNILM